MKRLRDSVVLVSVVFILIVCDVCQGATLRANKAIKGNKQRKSKVHLQCTYDLDSNETFVTTEWYKKGESESLSWANYTSVDVKRIRTYHKPNVSAFGLTFLEVSCVVENEYTCVLKFKRAGETNISEVRQMIMFKTQAPPETPAFLQIIPNKDTYELDDHIRFMCVGNVGKPAGLFWWFVVRNGTERNITKYADQLIPRPFRSRGSCTFEGTSMLSTNAKFLQFGSSVRCKIYHPVYATPKRLVKCSRFCLQSKQILSKDQANGISENNQVNVPNVRKSANNGSQKINSENGTNEPAIGSEKINFKNGSEEANEPTIVRPKNSFTVVLTAGLLAGIVIVASVFVYMTKEDPLLDEEKKHRLNYERFDSKDRQKLSVDTHLSDLDQIDLHNIHSNQQTFSGNY